MATFTFRKCTQNPDGSFADKTKIVAFSRSIPGNNSAFIYKDFLIQYLICRNSQQIEESETYYHTPTGNAQDCNVYPTSSMSLACLSALCGLNFGNTQCDWVS
jgi:hypothetical protein